MRLALHTVICCCVFITVLPLVKGATGELNTSLKKRFRAWLQSRMKRDLHNSLVTVSEPYSDIDVGPQRHRNSKIISPQSSFGLNIRTRRSASSKSSGCVFVTCAYHDLLHQLYLDREHKKKEDKAPESKMGSKGYGRRRRSLPIPLFLLTGRQRRSTEAAKFAKKKKKKGCLICRVLKRKICPASKRAWQLRQTTVPEEPVRQKLMNLGGIKAAMGEDFV